VEESLDLGELDDLVEAAADLGSVHAEDRAVEEDVLPAGQLGMEARSDLEERADAAVDAEAARRRLGDPRGDLEERRLPGSVPPDDAEDVAGPDLERDVVERPDRPSPGALGRLTARDRRPRRPERALDPLGHGVAERGVGVALVPDPVA